MADSTTTGLKDALADNPAVDRLKEEAQAYLRARVQQSVTGLGHKLGESVSRMAEPGQGGGGLARSLTKGGKALSAGKSPAQAAMSAGASQLKEAVKSRLGRSGGGKSKSVTIVEDIDVGVPVREAYDQWTQFQEFSTFAKGVVSVEQTDETSSNWKVKVAKSTRSWRANVTEQVPDERISWTTEGAKGTVKGVVTFHRLTDDLTRVLLVLEYFPQGLFEKTGNIWRAQGRRARLDLKLYRKFLMLRGEATDGWRGEIRDGDVVRDHEDVVREEDEHSREEDERLPRSEDEDAEYDDEPDDEYEDEDDDSEDSAYDDFEDEEAEYDADFDDEEADDPGDEHDGRRRAAAAR